MFTSTCTGCVANSADVPNPKVRLPVIFTVAKYDYDFQQYTQITSEPKMYTKIVHNT